MKTKLPEELKSDMPPTKWGKILSATPVVMTSADPQREVVDPAVNVSCAMRR